MINPLIFVPGLSALLFTAFEMPHKVKKVFFKVPIWVSSSAISILIGTIARGVLGPMTGFMTELILFPGLWLTKKVFVQKEKKIQEGPKKKKKKKKKCLYT